MCRFAKCVCGYGAKNRAKSSIQCLLVWGRGAVCMVDRVSHCQTHHFRSMRMERTVSTLLTCCYDSYASYCCWCFNCCCVLTIVYALVHSLFARSFARAANTSDGTNTHQMPCQGIVITPSHIESSFFHKRNPPTKHDKQSGISDIL